MSKQHLRPALLLILGLGWLLANSAQALQRPVDPVAVCVVTPRVEPVTEGDAIGLVPTPMPLLAVVEPLLELRIERQGLLVWQQLAELLQRASYFLLLRLSWLLPQQPAWPQRPLCQPFVPGPLQRALPPRPASGQARLQRPS